MSWRNTFGKRSVPLLVPSVFSRTQTVVDFKVCNLCNVAFVACNKCDIAAIACNKCNIAAISVILLQSLQYCSNVAFVTCDLCNNCNIAEIACGMQQMQHCVVLPSSSYYSCCVQRHHVDVAHGDNGGSDDKDNHLHHQGAAAVVGCCIATPQGCHCQTRYHCCFLLAHGRVQDQGWQQYIFPASSSRMMHALPPPWPGTEAKGQYTLVWFGIRCNCMTDPELLIVAGGITTMTARPIRSQQRPQQLEGKGTGGSSMAHLWPVEGGSGHNGCHCCQMQ